MKTKDQQAMEAMTALRELKEFDPDFDPAPYFEMVARHLLSNHGAKAIVYADTALVKMRTLGDNEGFELWEEVRAAMEAMNDQHNQAQRRLTVVH